MFWRLVLSALGLLWCAAAHAQTGCVPNPNASGPPFVNGCAVPASGLNAIPTNNTPQLYGAVTGGVTDSFLALQTAFNSGKPVYIPPGIYRSSAALTIPDNATINGGSWQPNTYGLQGAVIQCDATVTGFCVTLSNGTNSPAYLSNLTISRGAGSIPVGGGCLRVNGAKNSIVANVECYNHAIGFESDATPPNGIYNYYYNIRTCKITDSHFVVNTAPGIYVSYPQFGCVGTGSQGDVAGNNYVKITGNWDATFGTIHFLEPQFNTGQASATLTCGINLAGFTGSTNMVGDLEIIGGHMEVAQSAFCSDSTVLGLEHSNFVGTWYEGGWGGSNKLFKLNAATTPFQVAFTAIDASGWTDATLAPTGGFDDLRITGSTFDNTPMVITCVSNKSAFALTGNTYQGLTVSGPCTGVAPIITGTARAGGGSYSYSFTGILEVNIPDNSLNNCTLGLQFGGAAVGITYTTNFCQYELHGSIMTVTFNVVLSSKGSSTGTASLTGLPVNANANGIGITPIYYANMSGVCNGGANFCGGFASDAASVTTINLYTMGATSESVLQDTNFTNTSQVSGTLVYALPN